MFHIEGLELGGGFALLIIIAIVMATIQNSGGPPSPRPAQPPSPHSRPLLGILPRPVVLGDSSIGVQIVQVAPGGPAQRVGLEPGDIIARVDGRPFAAPEDMKLALGRSNGQPVLTVFRARYRQYVNVITPLN